MKLYATKSKKLKQAETSISNLKVLKSPKKLKTERYLKIHALTRPVYTSRAGERRQYTSIDVPQLRISGKWLAAAGFKIGGEVKIEVSAGQLIIRVVENETTENTRA